MIKIDTDKLKLLLKSFYEITKLKVTLYDENYNEMVQYPDEHGEFYPKNIGLCSYISQCDKAVLVCKSSNQSAFELCKKSMQPAIYKCPFQLYDSVSPLVYDGTIIGYFMLGQVRAEEDDFEKMLPVIEQCNLDKDKIRELYDKQQTASENYINAAIEILHAVTSYLYLLKVISQNPTDLGSKIEQFIEDNIAENIDVETLCKKLHYSRTNLYSTFKSLFGESIAQFIKRKRIEKAKKLLATTDISIAKIAVEVGIPDYNYFTKVFTKTVKISPHNFRKQLFSSRINKK